tara:strand:+ start:344 stop:751 length:408 start_codon:yes stop_codon:yes gene_type:complete
MNLACKAIFISGNRILLQHRDNDKNIWSPNHWGFFGGGADLKENPEDCLIREIREELSINCKIVKKIFECMHIESNTKNIFYCTSTNDQINNLKLKEGQNFGWFSIEEISKLQITWDTKIFLNYLNNHKLQIHEL